MGFYADVNVVFQYNHETIRTLLHFYFQRGVPICMVCVKNLT